jgi:hypothetical protein
MTEGKVQERKPDEVYCLSCGKPIKKDAVICPYCGVQLKELKMSSGMFLTPEQESREGRRLLGGIKIWFWIAAIGLSLYLLLVLPISITTKQAGATAFTNVANIIALIFIFAFAIALFVIPLVGLIKRKPFSVPFTRAMLVITMFSFPIGTIIGAVLWSRINHPLAKKYLNYIK